MLHFPTAVHRCFVCFPSPLPLTYQGDPAAEAFISGLSYGLVVLAVREDGAGLCDKHRPMVLEALQAIEEMLDTLETEGAFSNSTKEGAARAN